MFKRRKRKLRLDLREFQFRKYSGAIVIALTIAAALIFYGLKAYMDDRVNTYLQSSSYAIRSPQEFERVVKESAKPVAVMFESPTCPVCKKMYPYWAKLEEMSSSLPVAFYHVMYGGITAPIFIEYGITDTPTFIVFVGGQPVARHVGSFEGPNVTDTMLSWVMGALGLTVVSDPKKLAKEGLSVFNSKCSTCHGRIPSLDGESITSWLKDREAVGDRLARVLLEASSLNNTLEEYYGGYGRLMGVVESMRAYTDLTAYEVDRATYLLSYVSHVLLGREPPRFNLTVSMALGSGASTPLQIGENSVAATVIGSVAAFVAGVIAAFSPCVLPLLVTQVNVLASMGRRVGVGSCIACGLSSYAGVLVLALLFIALGYAASSIQSILLPVVGAAVAAAGAATVLGVPVEVSSVIGARRRGLLGFCSLYGLLAVQCSLPLVVGSLLLVVTASDVVQGLVIASSFALGISMPLAIATYAVSRLGSFIVSRVLEKKRLLDIIGGSLLLASGTYLIAYSMGIV